MYFRIYYNKQRSILRAFSLVELNKIILKSLQSNYSFTNPQRFYFAYKLRSYKRITHFTLFRRSCSLTNYPRSVNRLFKMSRHTSKNHAAQGYLTGMRKASF